MKQNDGILYNLRWTSRLVWESSRALTLASIVLIVFQGVLPLLGLYLVKLVVDAVSAGLSVLDGTAAFGEVLFLIVLSGGIFLLDLLCGSAAGWVNAAQGAIVTDRMHEMLHSKSIEVDLEYYEDPQYYDTLHRAQQ
jgi:ATP-binding cassette subfamily B protein